MDSIEATASQSVALVLGRESDQPAKTVREFRSRAILLIPALQQLVQRSLRYLFEKRQIRFPLTQE